MTLMKDFYYNKRVFITGHNGFKGSWMCTALKLFGAQVSGYSLKPNTIPSLYRIASVGEGIQNTVGDIRDAARLKDAVCAFKPEILIHMAAQPIVRESYIDPATTYETNVMGTVNMLEAVRACSSIKSVVNVTTDKVYKNKEWEWAYRESDELGGYDPYSNSKSCSELVTSSYIRSFFADNDSAIISTARAGNVIGGGDFANSRIIPDCVRALGDGKTIMVRSPNSVRPYGHVLEPVLAYLLIAQKQYEGGKKYSGIYNVGPNEEDCMATGSLVDLLCKIWGEGAAWEARIEENAPHEATLLKLDHSHITNLLGWRPRWTIHTALCKTVEWHQAYLAKGNISECMQRQICEYLKGST